jgi:hypothetical protein
LVDWYRALLVAHQFGDAKIEQSHLTPLINEHVSRLEVAMKNYINVGVVNRIEHLKIETNSRGDRKQLLVAVLIDPLTLHILESEKGPPKLIDTGIVEPCDV